MEWTPDRIRRFRAVGLSLSQPKFAKELGFCLRTIGNAERGTNSPSSALRRALDQALEQASEAQRNRFLLVVSTLQEDYPDEGLKAPDVRHAASLPLINSRQLTAHLDDIEQRDVHQGLDLAAASMDGKRYLLASPRERALFGVVHARALGAAGQKSAAAEALIKA